MIPLVTDLNRSAAMTHDLRSKNHKGFQVDDRVEVDWDHDHPLDGMITFVEEVKQGRVWVAAKPLGMGAAVRIGVPPHSLNNLSR